MRKNNYYINWSFHRWEKPYLHLCLRPASLLWDEHWFQKSETFACIKMFDSMISLILTYNSEVWGTLVKSDFKSWDNSTIEKAPFQFCKRYLEVCSNVSNMASWAGLGKYPMTIDIKILNYSYLQEKDGNSTTKQSLQILIGPFISPSKRIIGLLLKLIQHEKIPREELS